MDYLPIEIQGDIVKYIVELLIDYKTTEIVHIPIILGCSWINEYMFLTKRCKDPICYKYFDVLDIMILPSKQREALTRVSKRSSYYVGNIDIVDYKLIKLLAKTPLYRSILKDLMCKIPKHDKCIKYEYIKSILSLTMVSFCSVSIISLFFSPFDSFIWIILNTNMMQYIIFSIFIILSSYILFINYHSNNAIRKIVYFNPYKFKIVDYK